MNDFELFLNFGAVVEVRRNYRDDLYKFIKLIRKLGFLNEELKWFIGNGGFVALEDTREERQKVLDKYDRLADNDFYNMLDENYTDDRFWHLVDINNGKQNRICIEYQFGKGFTWDLKQNYINYDETMKILNVDELICACNKQDEFNLDYKVTSFEEEIEDKELTDELDYFCDFYEWELVKFNNGLYNILDRHTEEFVGYFSNENDNGTLRDCIERIYNRMVDYFFDEEDIKGLIQEGSQDYVNEKINSFVTLGKKYHLADDRRIEYFENFKNI